MADGLRSPAALMISRVEVSPTPWRPNRSSAASRNFERVSGPSPSGVDIRTESVWVKPLTLAGGRTDRAAFVSVRGMGQTIEFPSNGGATDGYLATPAQTPAPGVVVVQEWWGLVPQIRRTCDRLAEAGFVALAPDLFHGDIAEHTEMDRA